MKIYGVIIATYPNGKNENPAYARLEYKGRSTWLIKRLAEKHAREYKAAHLVDAWVQEL